MGFPTLGSLYIVLFKFPYTVYAGFYIRDWLEIIHWQELITKKREKKRLK